jgi:hypothetical protein
MGCLRRVTTFAAVALLFSACATNTPPPPVTWDGLERRPIAESGALYVRPGSHAKVYRTVMIDPPVVSTDKGWWPIRDVKTGALVGRHPVSGGEIQYIEDSIGPVIQGILAKELAAGGYRVVDRPRDDTLRVSSGLAFVFIDTPSSGMGRLRNDDTMTLVMNVSDASTGELLARFVDTKKGKLGILESPNTVANNMSFRRAFRDWAVTLHGALGKVDDAPSQREGSERTVARSRDHVAAPAAGHCSRPGCGPLFGSSISGRCRADATALQCPDSSLV